MRLGVARMAGGDIDSAFEDLESAARMDESGIQADLALVVGHLRRGEIDKALAAQAELVGHGLRQRALVRLPQRRHAAQAVAPQRQRHVGLGARGIVLALEQLGQARGGGNGDEGGGVGVHVVFTRVACA